MEIVDEEEVWRSFHTSVSSLSSRRSIVPIESVFVSRLRRVYIREVSNKLIIKIVS